MESSSDDQENTPEFRCMKCPYTTSTESVLKIHLKYMHKLKTKSKIQNAKITEANKISMSKIERQINGTFVCPKCTYTASTEQGWYSGCREISQ